MGKGDKINLLVPAKINFYLRVLRKRPDGYHDIDTLMQTVSLYDELTIEPFDRIELHCEGITGLKPVDNLAFKAARKLSEITELPGAKISLKKHIPQGAGLGGGSADAAFVIRGLIDLYGLKPDKVELKRLLVSLGADIPFFLGTGQMRATGIGDILDEIELPLNYQIIIVKPEVSINTAWAYKNLRIPLTNERKNIILEKRVDFADIARIIGKIDNDFEEVAFAVSDNLAKIKEQLIQTKALYASLSGSGSAIFGIYSDADNLDPIVAKFRGDGLQSFICRPIRLQSIW
jgi:4-diphosphocytidyl-2-C-methyl-D-erythritol kinase